MLLFSSKELFSIGLYPLLKILTRNSKQALTNPPTSVTGRAAWSSPLRTQGPCPAQGKACPDPWAMSRGRRRQHHQGTILDHKQISLMGLTREHPGGRSYHYPSYWKIQELVMGESPLSLSFFFFEKQKKTCFWVITPKQEKQMSHFSVTKDSE